MARERDGLVSVSKALAGLPGPVKAIREAPLQMRRYFTQADQVHQLVSASEADPDQRCCMDRGGDGIRPFPSGSVRRCVGTQAARVRSLRSELSGRPGSP